MQGGMEVRRCIRTFDLRPSFIRVPPCVIHRHTIPDWSRKCGASADTRSGSASRKHQMDSIASKSYSESETLVNTCCNGDGRSLDDIVYNHSTLLPSTVSRFKPWLRQLVPEANPKTSPNAMIHAST